MKTSLFSFLLFAPLSVVAHQNDGVSRSENDVLVVIQLCRCTCLILLA